MNKTTKEELLAVLNNEGGNIYDFIANNYWLLTREELRGLALEVVALLYTYAERLTPNDNQNRDKKLHSELLENITEYREELLSDD